MEKTVDVTAARRQFGTLLDEVFHKGDVFLIKRKGKALAKIVPVDDDASVSVGDAISPKQKILLDELNSLPCIEIDENPVEILQSMRKQKRVKVTGQYGK